MANYYSVRNTTCGRSDVNSHMGLELKSKQYLVDRIAKTDAATLKIRARTVSVEKHLKEVEANFVKKENEYKQSLDTASNQYSEAQNKIKKYLKQIEELESELDDTNTHVRILTRKLRSSGDRKSSENVEVKKNPPLSHFLFFYTYVNNIER
jgi:chromosome segregation ATPase